MRKAFFLFILGLVLLFPCFSQNMLIFGGEYNFTKPDFWNVGMGFNMRILNEYFQNDLMFNVGRIRAEIIEVTEDGDETIRKKSGEFKENYLFTVMDRFYFTLDGGFIGLRAGVFAALGGYDIIDFPTVYDLFFNGGGFVGICLFPRSLFSLAFDASPGYAIAFRLGEGPYINDSGFSFSASVGLRINFDKI